MYVWQKYEPVRTKEGDHVMDHLRDMAACRIKRRINVAQPGDLHEHVRSGAGQGLQAGSPHRNNLLQKIRT